MLYHARKMRLFHQDGEQKLGLTPEQVERARKEGGSNALTRRKRKSFLAKYAESFADPIIRILLIALGVNLIFLLSESFNWYEPVGIGVAILIATLISTLSEYGNESAFERMQRDAARIQCRVRRSGALEEIPIEDVVVGDIVLLQTGDRIPADGIVISGAADVDQSALNGESKEAHKRPSASETKQDDFLAANRMFRGAVVTGGEAEMRVTSVGDNTVYGHLAHEIQQDTRESPMRVRLTHLARTISRLGYAGAALVTLSYLFYELVMENNFNPAAILAEVSDPSRIAGTLIHCAMLAVSVIVMAVPEGLPMMITVVLSSNMNRMLKDNVLVRKLFGIETAGSLNILFTDKTGTLTKGKLSTGVYVDGEGKEYASADELARARPLWNDVYASMVCNNASSMTGSGIARRAIGGNATDRALMEAMDGRTCDHRNLRAEESIPFDSAKKFAATAIRGDIRGILVKGAPEAVLASCTHYKTPAGQIAALGGRQRSALEASIRRLSGQAIRLLALAIGKGPLSPGNMPSGMTFLALVGLRDDVRPEAAEGVRRATDAGIQVVMITGDSRDTARAIARETGILTSDSQLVVTSDELSGMSDAQLAAALPRLRVVARALPSDKSRLVRAAQAGGLVAGMTGDGINDAPALKLADVGFAMGSGTEVAKEAGDIVILDDNIASIGNAVLYGRTIFKSIRKFIIFQLTINLCAVSLAAIGPFIGIETPITVLQMLWINMVMDTLAGLAFSGEPPLADTMRESPKRRDAPILNRYMIGQILFTGLYSVGLCLAFLATGGFGLIRPAADGRYLLTAFFGLFMFMAIFNAANARTHRLNLLNHLGRNRLFLIVMGAVAAIQVGMLYMGGTLFRTAPLLPNEMLLIVLLAASVLPVDLARKVFLRVFKVKENAV